MQKSLKKSQNCGTWAKSLGASRVIPLLFGIGTTDLTGPLVQFQAAAFGRDDVRRVIEVINQELGENALASEVLDNVFSKWWPELESGVSEVLSQASVSSRPHERPEREMVEEIVLSVRTLMVLAQHMQVTTLMQAHLTPDLTPDFVRMAKLLMAAMEQAQQAGAATLRAILSQVDQALADLMGKLGRHFDASRFTREARPPWPVDGYCLEASQQGQRE